MDELTQINDHVAPNKLLFLQQYSVVYLDVFEKQISVICYCEILRDMFLSTKTFLIS